METLKKVVAAIIGILIIVALILLAKWLGDRIRERIFPAKTETQTEAQVTQPNIVKPLPSRIKSGAVVPNTVTVNNAKLATISATPATGPNDMIFVVMGFIAVAGLTSKFLANKAIS
jgi:hypothetical protein